MKRTLHVSVKGKKKNEVKNLLEKQLRKVHEILQKMLKNVWCGRVQ